MKDNGPSNTGFIEFEVIVMNWKINYVLMNYKLFVMHWNGSVLSILTITICICIRAKSSSYSLSNIFSFPSNINLIGVSVLHIIAYILAQKYNYTVMAII